MPDQRSCLDRQDEPRLSHGPAPHRREGGRTSASWGCSIAAYSPSVLKLQGNPILLRDFDSRDRKTSPVQTWRGARPRVLFTIKAEEWPRGLDRQG